MNLLQSIWKEIQSYKNKIIAYGFKESKKAKTPSFFSVNDFLGISVQMRDVLVRLGDLYGESVRYCLHKSPNDFLHTMLIYHPCKKTIPKQLFLKADSYYFLIKGSFKLINLNSGEVIMLDDESCLVAKIAKNIPYQMEMVSESLLFIEVREKNQ